MTAFRDRSWDMRMSALGDEAEGKFAEFATMYPFGFAPYGLARPPIQVHKLPPFIRYTPDFITTKYLYEVQGHGRDGTVKVKLDKLEALREWDKIYPVRLFLWNSNTRTRYDLPLDVFVTVTKGKYAVHGAFEDGAKPWIGCKDEYLIDYVV